MDRQESRICTRFSAVFLSAALLVLRVHAQLPVSFTPSDARLKLATTSLVAGGPTATLVASDGVSADSLGQALSISGDTAAVGAPLRGGTQGAVYMYVRSGTVWSQQAMLTASDGASGDQFGTSVSVDADTAVIGAMGASGSGAAYVFVRSGTSWTQQAKLTASDGASKDLFGISVAASGNTAIVGASGKRTGRGAAYVFARAGTSWTQQAILSASDGASSDQFGLSVALNGTSAVAGAIGQVSGAGAAYVFVSAGSSWTQQAKLIAPDGKSGDRLGFSVALSGDTVLAGADGKEAAYVFVRTGTSWSQQAKLGSSDGGGQFGYSVSLSGNTAAVGEPFNSQEIGAAFVFVRAGSSWTQQAVLTASDREVVDLLGFSVSVSGTTALGGAPTKAGQKGAAYAFLQVGANWAQQAKLTASDAMSGDTFGTATAVSGDTAVVGANLKTSSQGAAYVFTRSGANWPQQAKLTASNATAGDNFGIAVAVSGDTAVVGASGKSGTGAAFVFVRSGAKWSQQAMLTPSDIAAGDDVGRAVSIDGDTAVVAAAGKTAGQGAVYVFVRSGTTWTQQAKLTAANATNGDAFGRSVSVSGDSVLVGANGRNAFQGVAFVFARAGTNWTQQAQLTAADATKGDYFGFSVSLSGDTALIGAYVKGASADHVLKGAAYIFVRAGNNWTQQAELLRSDSTIPAFGIRVALEGDTAAVGGSGAVFVIVRSGTTWTNLTELTAAGAQPGDGFGTAAVALGGVLVVGAPNRNGLEGAADLFALPGISTGGIVHAASFAHTVAPGSIASVFGTNFAGANALAGTVPLPINLNGISVTVNSNAAPLIFVGPLQANFQVPFETAAGTATVVVTANGIPSPPATVAIRALAPGIFTAGNQAVVLNQDNSLADSGHPAKVGNVVVMYVTGLGALDHPIPTGSPASASPLSNAKVVPTVSIGGANAPVSFAGMTPGFVGLGQINMQVPKLGAGSYPVVIHQGGQFSNNPVMSVAP